MIYLDHHATTPLDPRVFEAMKPWFLGRTGNASSLHAAGREARAAVERARDQVARLVGSVDPEEIVFTSGATESDNLAVKGVVAAYRSKGDHVVTAATEHPALLGPARTVSPSAAVLPVDAEGLVDPAAVRAAITPATVLVSIMAANNEIGTLPDLVAIGAACREKGVLFHSDAAQAGGRIPIDVEEMSIDLLSLSAHKMHGPMGVGALYVRKRHPTLKRIRLVPLADGGGHERGLRSGTLNVPGIVGFGEACAIASREMAAETARVLVLRDRLWTRLSAGLDRLRRNGHPLRRLPNTLSVTFEGIEGRKLVDSLEGIALSTGAACSTATPEPSHVLKALGLREDLIHGTLRFGLGRFTTEGEIDEASGRIVEAVRRVRAASPLAAK